MESSLYKIGHATLIPSVFVPLTRGRETSDPGKISAEREDKIRFTFEMGQMVTSRL